MSNEHCPRENPQFYNFMDLARKPVDGPPAVAGIPGALMSRDSLCDAESLIVEIPPGWSKQLDDAEGSIEFFIMRGDLSFNGERVGPSGYVHVPQGGVAAKRVLKRARWASCTGIRTFPPFRRRIHRIACCGCRISNGARASRPRIASCTSP